ncbi:MAG: hypothetical protein IJT77_05415 [Clostridia bacterium]|nr:hypothetical protein [Clostridia bacterium]
MKKVLVLVIALVLLMASVSAVAEIKLGQVDFAAHGTRCFAVITAAMDGDKIVAAYIDEFQVMGKDDVTAVPNSETMFADLYAAGQVLGSKKVNNDYYSGLLKNNANATTEIAASYAAIEAFAAGKTIAELEAAIDGKTSEEMVDAVSGATLQDTLGYLQGILAAAKAAQ